MQDKQPSDPFQVVWPVGPPEETGEPKRERLEPVRETPVLLPIDVLLRRGARMLDPANATQPGRSRRGTDNKRLQNPSETAVIRYTPTAYVSDQILVQAGGRGVDRISAVTRELQGALDEATEGQPRRIVLEPADGPQLELINDRLATQSPAVVRLAVRSESETSEVPPDAWEVLQELRDRRPGLVNEIGLNHLMFAAGRRRGRLQRRALGRRGRVQRRPRLQRRARNRHGRSTRSRGWVVARRSAGWRGRRPGRTCAAGRWWRSWTPGWPSIPGSTGIRTTRWSPGCATTTTPAMSSRPRF